VSDPVHKIDFLRVNNMITEHAYIAKTDSYHFTTLGCCM
jgi:hypothetical protein